MKWLAVLCVLLCAMPVVAKAPPTVVVESGGVRMTSTGVVKVEFLGALPRGAADTVSVVATEAGAAVSGAKVSVFDQPLVRNGIYVLTGVAMIFFLQLVKRVFKLEGRKMLIVAVGACGVIAVLLSLLFRDGAVSSLKSNPWSLATGGGLLIAAAQIGYRLLKK